MTCDCVTMDFSIYFFTLRVKKILSLADERGNDNTIHKYINI